MTMGELRAMLAAFTLAPVVQVGFHSAPLGTTHEDYLIWQAVNVFAAAMLWLAVEIVTFCWRWHARRYVRRGSGL